MTQQESQQECHINKIIEDLTNLEEQLKNVPRSEKATVNNNEQPSERRSEEKKPSWWNWVRGKVKKIGKAKNEASNHASDGGSQGRSRRGKQDEDADFEVLKLQNDIRQMKAAFENLTLFQTNMRKNLERDLPLTKLRAILKKTDSMKPRSDELKEIRRKVFNMKCEIPSLLYKQSSRGLSVTDSETAEENGEIEETGRDIYLPSLHVSDEFKVSSAFKEILEKFEDLDFPQQLCLLSFAVFPENREIKRTMLMYWWIGEEFIVCNDSENEVKRILDEFITKGLLEPVEDETKLKPNSYKMEAHVHSAVVHLAASMDIFKLYSSKESSEGSSKESSEGSSKGNSEGSRKGSSEGMLTMIKSSKQKVCLVKGSSLVRKAKTSVMEPKNLQTIFNSSERYPDFTFKWFREMESLRVLYLGRWEQTAKRHIEVESTKFLKEIKSLKNLRLASFQGISRIEQLEKNICKLRNLVILDLKACYNLEGLPEDIGLLESLIYLDVSECYMLDRMPKGIKDLSTLQVLKGFVINQSDEESDCAVKNLVHLRKLSITVNKRSFEVEKLMESLRDLKQLESLKIAWGALFPKNYQKGNTSEETKETTNEDKENQGGHATEKKDKDLKEREDDQMQNKGQASKEKKGDVEEKGKQEDGRNEEANLEEGKKHDEVNAESLKSDKVVEGEKKTSPSQEATETIQNKPDDQKGKDKVEEEGDGDKGKADLEERKKQDEVEAEKSKSDKVVEGEKKASPPGESSDMVQKKPDDKSKVEKEGDGDKEKADLDEGKKRDEVEAERSKSDKVVKGDEKTSPPQESKDKVQSKPDDKSKVEKEGDGDKGKADPEEGKKHDKVETKSSKSDDGVEGVKKVNPSREFTDAIQNKPDDHQRGDKQEEKGDGEKEKVNLEEGKKKDQVKAESSKPDKVIKGDEKTSPPKDSTDTIQSKPDDQREISKVHEKGDGEKNMDDLKKLDGVEAKTQKSDKTTKFRKRVSFSKNKDDDLKRDNAMGGESHETPSPSRPPKESGFSKATLVRTVTQIETAVGNKAKQIFTGGNEHPSKDTTPKLPCSLKKLELECFPEKYPPYWLNPENLKNLEKLSIKGGKLSQISERPTAAITDERPAAAITDERPAAANTDERPTAANKWHVKILRLKYLHEFKAEWRDLKALFPEMKLLEKYECPKIAFCPTDGNGVWRSPNM